MIDISCKNLLTKEWQNISILQQRKPQKIWKQILQKKKTDTRIQYEKITAESFKENFGQNLCNTTQEKLDSEFTNFKSKCEELVKTQSVSHNKQIDHLQNEFKTKNKIIDQLLKSFSRLILNQNQKKTLYINYQVKKSI